MELKMDATASEALKQIGNKGYAKPFAADTHRISKIGVGFSSETRRIKEWNIADVRLSEASRFDFSFHQAESRKESEQGMPQVLMC